MLAIKKKTKKKNIEKGKREKRWNESESVDRRKEHNNYK